MPRFKVEVCRNFQVFDSAVFDIDADDEEEAKKYAMETAQDYPHHFDLDYEPIINYEFGEYIEQVDDDDSYEPRWGEND